MPTGHVERRGGKGWTTLVIEYDPDPVTGKRRREKSTIPLPPGMEYLRKEDALVVLNARLTDMNRGTYVTPKPITLANHLRAWLEDCRSRGLRDTTLVGYRNCVEKHIIPRYGILQLASLEPQHLRTMYADMLAKGFSPRMAELTHVVLHGALQQAVIDGKLYRNVADAVDPPRPRRGIVKILEARGITAFLEAAKGTSLYALAVLGIHTGLRRSELLALGWGDIDFDNARLSVTKGLTVVEGQFHVKPPKTQKSTRIIPLDKEALDLLAEMKVKAKHAKLFCDEDGGYLNPGTVSKAFSVLATEAGFSGITLHKLRHTFATLMLRAHVELKYVSDLLGHSSIKTTGDIYAHPTDDDLRNAVNTYSESLESTGRAPTRHNK